MQAWDGKAKEWGVNPRHAGEAHERAPPRCWHALACAAQAGALSTRLSTVGAAGTPAGLETTQKSGWSATTRSCVRVRGQHVVARGGSFPGGGRYHCWLSDDSMALPLRPRRSSPATPPRSRRESAWGAGAPGCTSAGAPRRRRRPAGGSAPATAAAAAAAAAATGASRDGSGGRSRGQAREHRAGLRCGKARQQRADRPKGLTSVQAMPSNWATHCPKPHGARWGTRHVQACWNSRYCLRASGPPPVAPAVPLHAPLSCLPAGPATAPAAPGTCAPRQSAAAAARRPAGEAGGRAGGAGWPRRASTSGVLIRIFKHNFTRSPTTTAITN